MKPHPSPLFAATGVGAAGVIADIKLRLQYETEIEVPDELDHYRTLDFVLLLVMAIGSGLVQPGCNCKPCPR